LGIFCHNIALFIRVGDFVAITFGENPPTHVQPGTSTIAPEVNHHGLPSAVDCGTRVGPHGRPPTLGLSSTKLVREWRWLIFVGRLFP
jgi:hypothetical protein